MRAAVVILVCSIAGAACGDGDEAPAAPEDAPVAAAPIDAGEPADAGPPVSYPESKPGLEQLVGDLLAAIESEDRRTARRLLDSLELPDHEAFFESTFGAELGGKLAAAYEPTLGQFDQLGTLLEKMVADGRTNIGIERFRSLTDKDAVVYQNLALRAMKEPTALYSVRLSKEGGEAFHLWSFVHHDGSFRWVGKLEQVAPDEEDEDQEAQADPELGDRRELRMRDVEALEQLAQP